MKKQKITELAKLYFGLIKQGHTTKDKIIIATYATNFILNTIRKLIGVKKKHDLISDVTIKNEDGLFHCANNIIPIITASTFHEPEIKKTILKHIKPKDVFIDVGANIGKYTIIIGSKLQKKGGKVIAFEPLPANFELLQKNIKLNKLNNVTPIKCALGNEEKKRYLYLENVVRGGVKHSLIKNNNTNKENNKILVEVRKLDNVLQELNIKKINLIKIDVEGFEPEVLKGATQTLQKQHPKIIFEALTPQKLKENQKILKQYNYKIKKINNTNYIAY